MSLEYEKEVLVERLRPKIFPATAGDYEGVMAISEGIYMGVDYLPYRYHTWLKDSQRRMFVAKSEGKVVGFDSFLLVDGGITAVVQGLRVADWMRGCGVAGILQRFCFKTLRSDHSNVTRIRLTTVENPPATMLNTYQIIHSKAVISVFISAEQLEDAVKILESRVSATCDNCIPPVFLEYSEVHNLFPGCLKEYDLLPGGFLMQAWLPITTNKANLDLMHRWKVQWLCSYPCDALGDVTGSSELHDVKCSFDVNNGIKKTKQSASKDDLTASTTPAPSNGFLGFLSLGSPMLRVPLGEGKHRLDIDIFGTDLSFAKIHVLYQLKEAVKKLSTGGSIICFVYIEESLHAGLNDFFKGFTPFKLCRQQLWGQSLWPFLNPLGLQSVRLHSVYSDTPAADRQNETTTVIDSMRK
ncbi:histidine N-acetyltransferase-like [Pelobates cultripes]|uniref:Histidine N-acetyltransferase-like n=1 Tax=Pelobates cultripes TaxID=61616 RepID=A0AAD1RKA6_PELCU|nr:histidine N-acetyltransferase-like [Pelobates cultripes]